MWPGRRPKKLIVQIDGAIGTGNQAAGLGVVIRDDDGQVLRVLSKRIRPQTNNEAEYHALIWALEHLVKEGPAEAQIFSDSEILVNQMRGRFSVHSPALKLLHRQACQLAQALPRVTYRHIPRDLNRLADALAAEALWTEAPWEKEK